MNKRFVIIGASMVSLLLVTVLAVYFMASRSAREQNNQQPTANIITENVAQPTETRAGAFVDYSDGVVAKTSGTKVLFFHAPWCPQCRMIEADIEAQESLPDNTTIFKVDYDSNQALRQQYGVTLQTTFVRVDDDGKLVRKYVAYNEPNYQAVYDNILR